MVSELVVRKSISVAAPPERAFEIFTARLDSWWPLATHSLAGERTVSAVIEGKEGGRWYEVDADGREGFWGTVTVWDPPKRLVVAWNVGNRRPEPTELEVHFLAEGSGTRVELEHRGWERFGPEDKGYEGYSSGWDVVLAEFGQAIERLADGAE